MFCRPVLPFPVAAAAIPIETLANIALANFTGFPSTGSSRSDENSDGSYGWLAWGVTVLQIDFAFPYSGQYTFTIPAYYLTGERATGNGLQVYIDQIPAVASASQVLNVSDYFLWWVTNVGTEGTGPSVNYTFTANVLAGTHSILVRMLPTAGGGQQLHCDRIIIASTGVGLPAEPAGSRDPYNYPLSAWSYWNLPIGSNVEWSNATDADTEAITGATECAVNSGYYTGAFFEGQSSDPEWTWTDSDVALTPVGNGSDPQTIHSPSGTAAGGGDGGLCITDGTNPRYAYVGFGATVSSPNVSMYRAKVVDNYNGFNHGQCQDTSYYTGIIRAAELTAGVINHMISFGMATQLVKAGDTYLTGLAWPACESDYDGPTGLYTGPTLYGSAVGIPYGTAMPSLTPTGQAAWNAFKYFGGQLNITGGEPNDEVFIFVEEGAGSLPQTANLATDWPTIVPYLRIMRNNGPNSIKGGGAYLTSMLPGLVSGLPAKTI